MVWWSISTSQKICIIVYSIVIIQCTIVITIEFFRVKRTPTLYSMCCAQLMVILWLFFGMIENMSSTTQELLFSIRFTLFPISFIGGFWLLFALFYANIISPENKLAIGLIFTPLAITYIPTLTDKYFYLTVIHKTIENPSITDWGIFFRVNYSITYVYIGLSVFIIVFKSIKDYTELKHKIILILIAPIISATVNILTSFKVVNDPGFDITPASFSVFSVLLSISIFKYKLLDLVQYAAIDIFQNIEDAIFILDTEKNIIEFNKIVEIEFKEIVFEKSMSMFNFLNSIKYNCSDMATIDKIIQNINDRNIKSYHSQFELIYDNDLNRRLLYDLYFKTLQKSNGKEVGCIVSIRNNTETSMLLLENERSRISGEIHDNFSNMINVVTMNLEHAKRHFDEDKIVLTCIDTAYETAKGIRLNLRRILEELAPLDIEKVGLLNALESMFKKVVGTGTEIDFSYNDIDDKALSRTRHGYVIYKTCMEAVNNSFFSGKAKKITIVLSRKNDMIRLVISDNGVGCESIKIGRGLSAMEKRIKAVNGRVVFDSSIDEGFNIMAEIPFSYKVKEDRNDQIDNG